MKTSAPKIEENLSSQTDAIALSILKNTFGYQSFRTGQQEVIDATLKGQDSLVIMATGNGKSLCYQIPALAFDGLTLVISPLISLMRDQVDQLLANGIPADCLNSTQSHIEQEIVQNSAIRGDLKLLYVSPEKVLTERFFQFILQCNLNFIAIDEAHCISQWGHDFRPEYTQLGGLKEAFPDVPMMALTATADLSTRRDILTQLKLHQPYTYIGSFDRPNIRYTVIEKFKATEQLCQFVKSQQGKSGIIYCNSRKRVEKIAEKLQSLGIRAESYHAGMQTVDRDRVQQDFQRDNVQIVVATIAFGMGINKSNVRFVVHFDIPRSIEAYYQETGRAGRDNLPAQAVAFYDPADIAWLSKLIQEKPESHQKQIEQHKLTNIAEFAESQTCRRLVLLNYFGEPNATPCQNCDICLDPPKTFDGLIDAQKILSTIFRVEQRYGVHYVIGVLRGMKNQKILDNKHDKLSVYGIGKEKSSEYWQSIIRQLIHLGAIQQVLVDNGTSYPYVQLHLTALARPILRGEQTLNLAQPRLPRHISAVTHKNMVTNYDKDLFARLRFLRKQMADNQNVPPYIIFNDATLQEMARFLPTSSNDLLRINGVGEIKLARYGQPFLQLIQAHKKALNSKN